MSEEREFMEALLCQRFNFFLVIFSLIIAAAFTTESTINRGLLLAVGTLVSLLVWLTIYRAHVKHHWIMRYLYKQAEHPAAVVNEAMKPLGLLAFFSVSRLIGIFIPLLCCTTLGTLFLLNVLGILETSPAPPGR